MACAQHFHRRQIVVARVAEALQGAGWKGEGAAVGQVDGHAAGWRGRSARPLRGARPWPEISPRRRAAIDLGVIDHGSPDN